MTTVLNSPQYPFDPTGSNPANRVIGELQPLTGIGDRDYYNIIPAATPFFATSMQMNFKSLQGEFRPLVEGIDYYLTHEFIGATRATGKPVYGSVTFLNTELRGTLILQYQTIGGEWTVNSNVIAQVLAMLTVNPRTVSWEQVSGYPNVFPPIPHEWDLQDMVGMKDLLPVLSSLVDAILTQAASTMNLHINTHSGNPHGVTCNDIGAVTRMELQTAVQTALNQITTTTDNMSEGNSNKYFTELRVLATHLQGLTVTPDVSGLAESDSLLAALAKLQAQCVALGHALDTKVSSQRPQFTGLGSQNLVTITMLGSFFLDVSASEAFRVLMRASGGVGFNIDNVGDMTGRVIEFAVTTVNDATGNAYALSWPSNVKWVDGAPPPRSTAANAKDFWYFVSEDNAATWTGSLSNANPR